MNPNPKIVALLPMKAHSQRVEGKNFRELYGKPLFHWILDTLLSVAEIDTIIINTDAEEILSDQELLSSERIKVRVRPLHLCGDSVSMNLIIADDISRFPADIYLMTHTTNPLLSANTIQRALSSFLHAQAEYQADSLFTVNRIQTRFYRKDGSPVNHNPKNLIPTQELETWYEENSNLYLFTSDSFAVSDARIGLHPLLFETPQLESIDIDYPEDWQLAEALIRYKYSVSNL